ncbi:hypothetical protein PENSPDRAFT_660090, partial [Peniophora sp. CONT]
MSIVRADYLLLRKRLACICSRRTTYSTPRPSGNHRKRKACLSTRGSAKRAMEQERVCPAGSASPVEGVAGREPDADRYTLHGARSSTNALQMGMAWAALTDVRRTRIVVSVNRVRCSNNSKQCPDRLRSPPQNRYEL